MLFNAFNCFRWSKKIQCFVSNECSSHDQQVIARSISLIWIDCDSTRNYREQFDQLLLLFITHLNERVSWMKRSPQISLNHMLLTHHRCFRALTTHYPSAGKKTVKKSSRYIAQVKSIKIVYNFGSKLNRRKLMRGQSLKSCYDERLQWHSMWIYRMVSSFLCFLVCIAFNFLITFNKLFWMKIKLWPLSSHACDAANPWLDFCGVFMQFRSYLCNISAESLAIWVSRHLTKVKPFVNEIISFGFWRNGGTWREHESNPNRTCFFFLSSFNGNCGKDRIRHFILLCGICLDCSYS